MSYERQMKLTDIPKDESNEEEILKGINLLKDINITLIDKTINKIKDTIGDLETIYKQDKEIVKKYLYYFLKVNERILINDIIYNIEEEKNEVKKQIYDTVYDVSNIYENYINIKFKIIDGLFKEINTKYIIDDAKFHRGYLHELALNLNPNSTELYKRRNTSEEIKDNIEYFLKSQYLIKLFPNMILVNAAGGSKKLTKQKPKGKHDDLKMKDIKELCKANKIKLSKVVKGKNVAYKKKELLTKLKKKLI
jgi:hypothetical protein